MISSSFRCLLLLLLFSSHFLTAKQCSNPPYLADFVPSIHRYGIDVGIYNHYVRTPHSQSGKLLKLTETLYNNNLTPIYPALSIPKVVHQIWLGSPVPKKFEKIMKTWMKWHGWEYKLWTEAEVAKITLVNPGIYQKVKNLGAKSDILRYEILYQFGGVYVDTDFECFCPAFFDWAAEQYDFFAGIETLKGCPKLHICNALIGSKPGHPLLQRMLQELQNLKESMSLGDIINATGPGFLSKQFLEYYDSCHEDTIDIVFTPTYFYPITKAEFKLKQKEQNKLIRDETVALHYWSGEWLKGLSFFDQVDE
ncbi:glycosyltransferase family 32 protein [Estrella lausannensis]|uniref:Conserved putative secreted protein n=1 Tax=Estrella lausannensis TaxID=483423 RepID=A0A0H5DQI3_9BACT|nr:glycosyltransferase [Estrella lausannensis]CRX38792.1 Conserved putative secreted protein [Estrella lausannensis]